MAQKIILTEEQRKQHKKESQQRYLAKIKAQKAVATNNTVTDYKVLYENCLKENNVLVNQVTELEKLCKTYAEKTSNTQQLLQRATLEYNARIKHMLECVRHALVSMQFAAQASDNEGGKQ